MRLHHLAIWTFAIGMAGLESGPVSGQPTSTAPGHAYPNKPIRIVTSATGGGSDQQARLIAHGISGSLGQPIIVDNRGGGTAAVEIVAKAPPDGYTLYYAASLLWLLPLLQNNASFDTFRDFAPISLVVNSRVIALVNPAVAVKSIKELIALAKAKPGVLNYGSGGTGSNGHMSMELFKFMAGL